MLPPINESYIGLAGLPRLAVMVPLAPMSSRRPKLVDNENLNDPLLEVHSRKAMSAVVGSRMFRFDRE